MVVQKGCCRKLITDRKIPKKVNTSNISQIEKRRSFPWIKGLLLFVIEREIFVWYFALSHLSPPHYKEIYSEKS